MPRKQPPAHSYGANGKLLNEPFPTAVTPAQQRARGVTVSKVEKMPEAKRQRRMVSSDIDRESMKAGRSAAEQSFRKSDLGTLGGLTLGEIITRIKGKP